MTNEQLVELLQMGIDTKPNMKSLYMQNKGMITRICRQYTDIEPLEDLQQTAYIGLAEAVKHYDSGRGFKFVTYAGHWIKQSIRQYLTESGLVRIPPNMKALIFRYKRLLSAYEADHAGLLPKDEDIRRKLHITEKQLADIKKYVFSDRIKSLDRPLDEESGNTMLDYMESPEDVIESIINDIYRQEMREDVQEAMNIALTQQEQDTIKAYFWHRATLGRIARQKNVTVERVRQQLAKAQRKLSRGKAGMLLTEYARIEGMRYCGGFSFFKNHGSIIEYEIVRREEVREKLELYLEMKRQERERHEKRIGEAEKDIAR
ncbi:MAG: sigma-70 family RNA polymerase sigma factor [Acetatifactor sp.]|nr:sigma-70 family RNA polymerase sigma factor [Acetatifactor sp.]